MILIQDWDHDLGDGHVNNHHCQTLGKYLWHITITPTEISLDSVVVFAGSKLHLTPHQPGHFFSKCIFIFLCCSLQTQYMYMQLVQYMHQAWWRHQMETSSVSLAFVRGIRWPMNFAALFSLICAWTNGWVNNRDAGDLRRHRAHYDCNGISVAVMLIAHSCVSRYLWI